jgi:hypothetical protein
VVVALIIDYQLMDPIQLHDYDKLMVHDPVGRESEPGLQVTSVELIPPLVDVVA